LRLLAPLARVGSRILRGRVTSVGEALLNHVKDDLEGTYNLYTYWPERKRALSLWQEKLSGLEREAVQGAA